MGSDEPIDPRALQRHYASFLRPGRILLTGHSHQAWPDVAREGLLRSFEDAALHVDDKWEAASEAAEAVRGAVARRIGADASEIALGASTHELVTRFLSALDLARRPHLVTTSGEFHSMHRQLSRLAEAGVEVTFVPAYPVAGLAERLASALRDDTAALLVSTVLFETASIVPNLSSAIEAAQRRGAEVLLDAYHAFGVVPFEVRDYGRDPIFVTAGGYKYAQWGEGCCWLRVPPETELRPVYTGWFSDFASLAAPRDGRRVAYGPRPSDRFAGSTYDPASHYRARAVVEMFDAHALTVERLRALSLRQTERILRALPERAIRTPRDAAARGGFVSVEVENASSVVSALREHGIFVDARGDLLRIGPAPYVTDDELDEALRRIAQVVT
jgi:selenocysteine lyase/cysteine desulfurase